MALMRPLLVVGRRCASVHVIGRITPLLLAGAAVKVGIEAAGHSHLPLLSALVWSAGWELLELNPGHVSEQRKVL